ncbi:MAG: phage major capsid protein [Ruminococcus sp.]
MSRVEYLNQRNALIAKAEGLIQSGKIEDANKAMDEVKKLDKDYEAQAQAEANLKALNGEGIGVRPIGLVGGSNNEDIADPEPTNSVEYRTAFMNFVTKGTAIPSKFQNAVSTSSGNGAVTPVTLYEKIYSKLESYGRLYARVFKTNYPTALNIPVLAVKPSANWVDEDKGQTAQDTSTDKIAFGGHKLQCKVAFSLFMNVTSLEIFESQYVELIAEAMAKSIDSAIIGGSGSGMPDGIKNIPATPGNTVEIAKTGKLTYDTLIEGEQKLPSVYDDTAVYLMTKKSFFSFLAMKDTAGQPIARISAGIDGKPAYSLIGREVIPCDGLMENYADTVTSDTDFAYIFDLSYYVLNEVMGIFVKRYTDDDNDNEVIKATALIDGKPIQTDSFVKFIKKSA